MNTNNLSQEFQAPRYAIWRNGGWVDLIPHYDVSGKYGYSTLYRVGDTSEGLNESDLIIALSSGEAVPVSELRRCTIGNHISEVLTQSVLDTDAAFDWDRLDEDKELLCKERQYLIDRTFSRED